MRLKRLGSSMYVNERLHTEAGARRMRLSYYVTSHELWSLKVRPLLQIWLIEYPCALAGSCAQKLSSSPIPNTVDIVRKSNLLHRSAMATSQTLLAWLGDFISKLLPLTTMAQSDFHDQATPKVTTSTVQYGSLHGTLSCFLARTQLSRSDLSV